MSYDRVLDPELEKIAAKIRRRNRWYWRLWRWFIGQPKPYGENR